MRTFTDHCDDDLQVDKWSDGVELFSENETSTFLFDRETARDLAQGILETIGESDGRPVSAKELSFNEGAMRLAAIHGKTVEFRYVKGDSRIIESRRLVPSSVKGSGEHLRFTGYDPDRDETRAFRLDRIKGDVRVLAA